ncbi:MAG TPA: HD domain-containing protein [Candidatus Saccharimonadales bacterium]
MEDSGQKPWFAELSLHTLTEEYQTEGLVQRFNYEISRFAPEERAMVYQAFVVASILHFEDSRVVEPYINHPLRVALRLMTHYEVDDAEVICAALLHDTVEDHARVLAGPLDDGVSTRELALSTLASWFSPRVAGLVRELSNPIVPEGVDKNEYYYTHLNQLAELDDPWPILIKLSDFTDNGTGILYTPGPKAKTLSTKYYPAIPIFRRAIQRTDLPISEEVRVHISQQLDITEERLLVVMAQ